MFYCIQYRDRIGFYRKIQFFLTSKIKISLWEKKYCSLLTKRTETKPKTDEWTEPWVTSTIAPLTWKPHLNIFPIILYDSHKMPFYTSFTKVTSHWPTASFSCHAVSLCFSTMKNKPSIWILPFCITYHTDSSL